MTLKSLLSILEAFQRLGYDRPTEDQALAVRNFVLGCDVFVMLPTGSGKSLCYASLPYIFDSLRRAAGEKDAHHSWWCLERYYYRCQSHQFRDAWPLARVIIVLALAVCFRACSSLTKHGRLQANIFWVIDVSSKGFKCVM